MSKISMKGSFDERLRRFVFLVLPFITVSLNCTAIQLNTHNPHKKAPRCIGGLFVLWVSDLAAKILF